MKTPLAAQRSTGGVIVVDKLLTEHHPSWPRPQDSLEGGYLVKITVINQDLYQALFVQPRVCPTGGDAFTFTLYCVFYFNAPKILS